MMRYRLHPLFRSLLHGIIQEEVYQYRIHLRLRMLPLDMPSNQLHAPDATAPQLHLPATPASDLPQAADLDFQWRTVPQTAQRVQHLWDSVIGKHGDDIYIVETAEGLALEAGPEVGDEYLRAFLEADRFGVESGGVVEAGEVSGEEINEGGSGVVCLVDQSNDRAREIRVQDAAGFADTVNALLEEGYWSRGR